ncbi:MAG: hypothetical protein ACE5JF_00220 [Anaerolineales bacterium]
MSETIRENTFQLTSLARRKPDHLVSIPSLPAIRAQFPNVENIDFWVRFVLTLPPLLIALSAPLSGYIVATIGRKIVLITATVMAGLIVSQPVISSIAAANTFLIAGVILLAFVPFIFVGRGRLRSIGTQTA